METTTRDCSVTTFDEHPEVELIWYDREPLSEKVLVDYVVDGTRCGSLIYPRQRDLYRTIDKYARRVLRIALMVYGVRRNRRELI